MIGKWLARAARTALLAALVPCVGCCAFWERECGFHQQPPACAPVGCGCPTTAGYPTPAAAPQAGWVPTSGTCGCR